MERKFRGKNAALSCYMLWLIWQEGFIHSVLAGTARIALATFKHWVEKEIAFQ